MHRKVSKKIKQCKNISERIVAICNIVCYIYSNEQGVPDFEEYHFLWRVAANKEVAEPRFPSNEVKITVWKFIRFVTITSLGNICVTND